MPDEIDINKEFQKLVLARLSTLPSNASISIGANKEYSKEELLQHVESGDSIGQKMIEIDRAFLTALKEGTLFER